MKSLQSARGLNRPGAFTLVEVMIVVAIIGLLAAIAIPNFIKARNAAQVKACISNLRVIEVAKAQWALENRKNSTDTPTESDVTAYLRGNRMPTCPGSGTYRIRRVNQNPSCTLSSRGHTIRNINSDDDPDPD